jgi:hypothetical protein
LRLVLFAGIVWRIRQFAWEKGDWKVVKKKKRSLDTRIADAFAVAECLKALGEVTAAAAALRKGKRDEAVKQIKAALKILGE